MGRAAISIERIIMRDGLRCHYCRQMMNIYHYPTPAQQKDKKRFTFEHVVPRSHGGSYGLYNIVGACAKCNTERATKPFACFCEFCQQARVRFELKQIRKAVMCGG
jgi:hypothetical protein